MVKYVLLQNDSDDFCYFLYDEYYLDNEEVFFNLEVVCQMQFEVCGSNIAKKKQSNLSPTYKYNLQLINMAIMEVLMPYESNDEKRI